MAKKKNKKKISPIVSMVMLIVLVSLISWVLSLLNVDSNKTMIVNGTLETSIVIVKNIFSIDGMKNFFSNIITNFNLVKPLALMILSLASVGIAKNSGLLKHLFTPLKKIKFTIITFFVLLISVLSTFIGDYSYIILLPLIAVMYEYLGKNPVLGLITVFLGITMGYGTGFFYNYNDLALGTLTQASAIIEVDATYKYTLTSNLYIMIFSSLLITYILTLLINKYLSKKVVINQPYEDELATSKKAFGLSFIGLLVSLMGIAILVLPMFGGALLDNTKEMYLAKVFSETSGFSQSFMFLYLIVVVVVSLIYGFTSKNFKNSHDFSFGLVKEFDNIGYLFILLFLYSILIGIIDWTNIGVVIANKLITLLSVLEFTGMPLIICTFIFIILMSILLPNTLEKWSLISPLLIPLFMRANISPDFTQFMFSVADGIGKSLTPVFIYFIVLSGLIQKYNLKENKIGLYDTIKLSLPIILTMIFLWILVIIIWYVSGLPLGIGTFATM